MEKVKMAEGERNLWAVLFSVKSMTERHRAKLQAVEVWV
jgi:hypothetical protein